MILQSKSHLMLAAVRWSSHVSFLTLSSSSCRTALYLSNCTWQQ
jgi:hypothetical protein